MAPTKATFADTKETYQAALMSLFSGKPEDAESDLSKLLLPTFTLKAHKEFYDYPGFVAHMRRMREILPSVKLNITQFLRDGPNLAERHSSQTTTEDGKTYAAETFMFAEISDDGRIAWIVEAVDQQGEVNEESSTE